MTRNPDTFGSQDPTWIAQLTAEVAEYDSYLPMIEGNGRTGSTRVPIPKVAKRTVHVARTREDA